ncbi:unnamed protein product [Lepeophtheirus salmonis]|uniref:(salmon louse) hypothetical protein n=1 Tax=Lepeophtheirus salmonis TaxID=72036 RepID=A0A7R8D582_LEPSM|nr:unnamed protein product [Lepeophtheirus salmonis]CAF3033690.1 unnamed protein product [Lepeophtheirus salmonis]
MTKRTEEFTLKEPPPKNTLVTTDSVIGAFYLANASSFKGIAAYATELPEIFVTFNQRLPPSWVLATDVEPIMIQIDNHKMINTGHRNLCLMEHQTLCFLKTLINRNPQQKALVLFDVPGRSIHLSGGTISIKHCITHAARPRLSTQSFDYPPIRLMDGTEAFLNVETMSITKAARVIPCNDPLVPTFTLDGKLYHLAHPLSLKEVDGPVNHFLIYENITLEVHNKSIYKEKDFINRRYSLGDTPKIRDNRLLLEYAKAPGSDEENPFNLKPLLSPRKHKKRKAIKEKSTIPEIAAFDTSSSNENDHITDPLADVSDVTQAQEVLETNKPSLTEDIILADKSDVPQVGGIINSEPTSNTDMESELALPGLKRTRIIYDSSPESKRINVTPPCDISPHIIQQPTPIFAVGNTVSSHNSLIIDSPSSIRRTRKRLPAPPSPPTSMTIDELVHESCDEPKDLDIGEPIVDIACDELVDFDGQQIKDCNPAILKSTIQAHAPLNPINPVLKVKCTPNNNQVNNNVNKNNHKKVQNKQREHIPSSVENRSANKGKLTYANVTRANIDPNYLAQQIRKYIPTTLSQGIPLVQTKVLENTLAKRHDFKSLVTLDAKRIELDLQLAIVTNQKGTDILLSDLSTWEDEDLEDLKKHSGFFCSGNISRGLVLKTQYLQCKNLQLSHNS